MQNKISIKQILTSNENWWDFYNKHQSNMRPAILIAIIKLLSCKHTVRGYHKYCCSNPNCHHVKYVSHTCKCKACSSCGKKATEIWIQKQNQILPQTSWQHITFTIPSELWDFFWHNRTLLNLISAIAAQCIKSITQKKHLNPGIFVAIHTFGRDLKRNVHIHLSVTTGGITNDNKWKKCFFHQETLMRMWRYQIIKMFRDAYKQKNIVIPKSIQKTISHIYTFEKFLNFLYAKRWIVYCAKPTDNYKHNLNYLGRYIKKPAIAESKLKHYNGNEVVFKYLDHNSKTYRNFKLSVDQFIARFIQHIPDVGFRMIRYYGFLSNRARGNLLPIVYSILGQQNITLNHAATFAKLLKQNFNVDPFVCIICGCKLQLTQVSYGNASIYNLLNHHRQLALLKNF